MGCSANAAPYPAAFINRLIRAAYPLVALGSVSPASSRRRVPSKEAQMLGKLSIAGAGVAILMIPTALPAQVGGAVNAGAAVRGAVSSGIPTPADLNSLLELSVGPVAH
jgi:hypothetical protein